SAHPVVVEPVQRNGSCGAKSVGVRELDVERNILKLPSRVQSRIRLDERTFGGERRVEVRASRSERGAEEAARCRRRPRGLRPDVEGLPGAFPSATKCASVQ